MAHPECSHLELRPIEVFQGRVFNHWRGLELLGHVSVKKETDFQLFS